MASLTTTALFRWSRPEGLALPQKPRAHCGTGQEHGSPYAQLAASVYVYTHAQVHVNIDMHGYTWACIEVISRYA